jgi:hypothetical protein
MLTGRVRLTGPLQTVVFELMHAQKATANLRRILVNVAKNLTAPVLTLTAQNESQQNCAAQVIFIINLEVEKLMRLLYY